MKLKRFFFPVGQGNFCAEIFTEENSDYNFSIVYDCGTKTKINDFEDFYKEFPKNKKIDICFISHFHIDHYNQIKSLINILGIKTIVIPKLSVEEKIISIFSDDSVYSYRELYLKNTNKTLSNHEKDLKQKKYFKQKKSKREEINFLLNLRENLKDIKIIEVTRHEIQNKKDYIKSEEQSLDIDDENFFSLTEIESSTLLTSKNLLRKWIFKVFYVASDKMKKREEQIKNEFKNQKIKVQDGNIITDFEFDKVLKIYRKIAEGMEHNEYSLILYSGYLNQEINKIKSACLYTGDSEFEEILKKDPNFFKKIEYDNIGTLQVPHHGGISNSVEELYNDNIKAIICAKKNNPKNHHPSEKVLSFIDQKKSQLKLLTEFDSIECKEFTL